MLLETHTRILQLMAWSSRLWQLAVGMMLNLSENLPFKSIRYFELFLQGCNQPGETKILVPSEKIYSALLVILSEEFDSNANKGSFTYYVISRGEGVSNAHG